MSITLATWVSLAALVWLIILGVLLYAVRRRWLARYEN